MGQSDDMAAEGPLALIVRSAGVPPCMKAQEPKLLVERQRAHGDRPGRGRCASCYIHLHAARKTARACTPNTIVKQDAPRTAKHDMVIYT